TQKAVKTSAADQGAHRPGRPIRDGDPVVVGVRNIEAIAPGTDPTWLAERRRLPGPVRPAGEPAPEPGHHGAAPRVQTFDLVVVAVGHEQRAVVTRDPER